VSSTELSAETRNRVLETAWRRVREHGPSAASVKDIAKAAGVSRQLVYFHYGSRAGLLTAMARHRDETSGFVDEVAAARTMEPPEGLEHLLRAWCDYLPTITSVARALEVSDDGGSAWRQRMGELREALRAAIARVRPAPGWTVDDAADWAWSRIQPTTFQHLVGERGWTQEEYTERTVRSLMAELVR
jgi:AcrR family transcriptional regulator